MNEGVDRSGRQMSGEGAHAAVEWVDLASLERCRDLYVAVASGSGKWRGATIARSV